VTEHTPPPSVSPVASPYLCFLPLMRLMNPRFRKTNCCYATLSSPLLWHPSFIHQIIGSTRIIEVIEIYGPRFIFLRWPIKVVVHWAIFKMIQFRPLGVVCKTVIGNQLLYIVLW
jgi:hypothetical protein